MKTAIIVDSQGWRQRMVGTAPPTRRGRNGLHVFLLVGLLLPAGCRDSRQKAQQEIADARAAVARLQGQLAVANGEITKARDEGKALRQTRDELQEQVDQLSQERDEALTLARQARDAVTQLTTQADGRVAATANLERQVAELKALVKEQQAIIEELQKGTATQPLETETPVDATTDQTIPTEPNEVQ